MNATPQPENAPKWQTRMCGVVSASLHSYSWQWTVAKCTTTRLVGQSVGGNLGDLFPILVETSKMCGGAKKTNSQLSQHLSNQNTFAWCRAKRVRMFWEHYAQLIRGWFDFVPGICTGLCFLGDYRLLSFNFCSVLFLFCAIFIPILF